MEVAGPEYSFTMGSDVDRDGVYLEVTLAGKPSHVVAEVFYSDASGRFTISCFEQAVPIELMEHLIAEARRRLPPSAAAPK